MAINIFTGAVSSNSSIAGNWSLGVVPTLNDGHVATWNASSPNCIINLDLNVNSFNSFAYTNTITITNTINTYGNITLGINNIFAGSSIIAIFTSCIFTSNGKTAPSITIAYNVVITLNGSAVFTNLQLNYPVIINKTTTETLSVLGFGGFDASSILSGTALVYIANNATFWGPAATIASDCYINGNVTIYPGTDISFSGTISYVSGTITSTNARMIFLAGATIYGFNNTNYIEHAVFQGTGVIGIGSDFYCRDLIIGNTTDVLHLIGDIDTKIFAQNLISKLTTGTCGDSGIINFNLNGHGCIMSASGISNYITEQTPLDNKFQNGVGTPPFYWNTPGNWSRGVVPTANDGFRVVIDNSSPTTITVNVAAVCNSISFQNTSSAYSIILTNSITSYGNIGLGISQITWSGTGGLILARSCMLSSPFNWGPKIRFSGQFNTYYHPTEIHLQGALTIIDNNITIVRSTSVGSGQFLCEGLVMTGNSLPSYLGGSTRTSEIKLIGGTWSGIGVVNNPIYFDADLYSKVSVTISGSVNTAEELNYVSGNIITTGSTVGITYPGDFNLTPNITFNNLTFNKAVPTCRVRTVSDLIMNGTLNILSTPANPITFVDNNIYCQNLSLGTGGAYYRVDLNNHTVFLPGAFTISIGNGYHEFYNGIIECYGINSAGAAPRGNVVIIVKGGSIISSSAFGINLSVTIDGSVSMGNVLMQGLGALSPYNFTLLSGSIISTGILTFNQAVNPSYIDLKGSTIQGIKLDTQSTNITLKSDLIINSISTVGSSKSIISDIPGTHRKLTLTTNNQDIGYTNFTDINAEYGKPIYTYKSTVSNCKNIASYNANSFSDSQISIN